MKKKFAIVLSLSLLFVLSACSFGNEEGLNVEKELDWFSLDVNPSIDVIVDEDDEIVDVSPNNEEAKIILSAIDFHNMKVGQFIDEWLDSLDDFNYLIEGENIIYDGSERVRRFITERIEANVGGRKISVVRGNLETIWEKIESDFDGFIYEVMRNAELSFGESRMILNLIDEEISEEELMNIIEKDKNELARFFTERIRERNSKITEEIREANQTLRENFRREIDDILNEEKERENLPENASDLRERYRNVREEALERAKNQRTETEERDETTEN